MEDLSGDMAKTVTPPILPNPKKRPVGWTLLFVGGHGKIIRLQKIVGIMMAWVIVSVITLAAAVSLGFFYHDASLKNDLLEQSLRESRRKIRALRDEKDLLLARVVVAEANHGSRVGTTSLRERPVAVKKKEVIEKRVLPAAEPNTETHALNPTAGISMVSEPENSSDVDTEPAAVSEISESTLPSDPAAMIAIDDFFSVVEPDSNRLRVKYKIRNIDPNSNPISGRTFLILKAGKQSPENWLVLPDVGLASGKPVDVKRGRSFSITRFKTIRFKVAYQKDVASYETATVLVFATGGELLLEKSFSIEDGRLDPPPAG